VNALEAELAYDSTLIKVIGFHKTRASHSALLATNVGQDRIGLALASAEGLAPQQGPVLVLQFVGRGGRTPVRLVRSEASRSP
jgi:hypothetical protein